MVRRSILPRVGVGLSGYLLVWANIFVPVVRVTPQIINDALFSVAQVIPLWICSTGLSALRSLRADEKEVWFASAPAADAWLAITVGALLLIPAAPIGLFGAACTALDTIGGSPFELRETVASDAGTVSVHRTDGGATTAFGIVVRQECTIGPGLLLVRTIAHEYPADAARLMIDDRGAVRIAVENHEREPPDISVQTVPLRRFCWGPVVGGKEVRR
jgi:hypothetical protein